jgi:pSer/pThr/pTyr-binding forkhead associated (FHA) protein
MTQPNRRKIEFFLYNNRSSDFFRLYDGTTIGRTEGEIPFPSDELISKKHCSFFISGNEIYIEDFDSTNKTKVNSVPIQPRRKRRIRLNDVIEVGNQRFILSNQDQKKPGNTQDQQKKKQVYKAVKKSDGSLTPYITKFITKRTLVNVNWTDFQVLKLKHRFKKERRAIRRKRKPPFLLMFIALAAFAAFSFWYIGFRAPDLTAFMNQFR